MKKRTISVILSVVLLLCFSVGVFGVEEQFITNQSGELEEIEPLEFENLVDTEDAVTCRMDEYNLYNNLQQKSRSTLSKQGYSDEEISSIKTNTYEDLIRERGKLPEEQLLNMGYNEGEISIIKDPESTDQQLRSANINSFTISSRIAKFMYAWSEKYTYGAVYMEWMWTKKPFSCFKDAMILSWSGGMTLMPYAQHNMSRYTLWNRNTTTGVESSNTYGVTDNHIARLNAAVSMSFNLETSSPGKIERFYFKGAARAVMKKQGQLGSLTTLCSYAHYANPLSSIGVSIGVGPLSISLNPTTPYKEQIQQYTGTYFDWR